MKTKLLICFLLVFSKINTMKKDEPTVIVQNEEYDLILNHFANIICDNPFFGKFPIVTAKHIDTGISYCGHINEQTGILTVEQVKADYSGGWQKLRDNKKAITFYETMFVASNLDATDLTKKKLLDRLHEILK